MKTIGVCIPTIEGGVVCHQEIGREASRRGIAYPQIITHTPLYEPIQTAISTNDFKALVPVLVDSVNRTAKAGAEIAIMTANTTHVIFEEVAAGSAIPLVSILDAVADYCVEHGYKTVGILGTSTTVKQRLYDAPLEKRGVAAVYAQDDDNEKVMDLIQKELIKGVFLDESREVLEYITRRLGDSCDAIVLGCTELPLVLTEENCKVKLVDTTRILAHAALDAATR